MYVLNASVFMAGTVKKYIFSLFPVIFYLEKPQRDYPNYERLMKWNQEKGIR